ncbi:BamA/TamA family outer membrane protein [Bdellovibrio sp. HCB209]|uniref:BamA/TamA family outer membrane protein n=1 Tax=Bdellovibrio sp. HCB209 TaxID=3394354 RepID=UPI0039B3793C
MQIGVKILLVICCSSISWGALESSSNYGADNDDLGKSRPPIADPTQKTPLDYTLSGRTTEKTRQGEWVIAPIPSYDPSQGWGVALLAQKIFSHSENVKPSMAVGGVFATEKKSYGAVAGYIGRLHEDSLRFNIFGGYAKINSDFYGVGKNESAKDLSVLLEQDYTFASAQFLPRWANKVFAGLTLTFVDMKNSFDIPTLPIPVSVSDKLNSESWVPGIKAQFDGRDNTFYPTQGVYTNLQIQFYDENWGGGHTFQKYKANLNKYFQAHQDGVLAARGALQANVGDVPFYDMAVLGLGPDMRGFKAGKYRDKVLWDIQGEYRYRFTDHWGVVLFSGAGDVTSSLSDITLKNLLWMGGTGLRYRLGRENPVDFSVDLAHGDDWVWYFSVNQAF